MERGDMPAQPVPEEVHALFTDKQCRSSVDCTGLTIREELAARFLAANLTRQPPYENTVKDAFDAAEAFLNEAKIRGNT